jgi:hypothetical protein
MTFDREYFNVVLFHDGIQQNLLVCMNGSEGSFMEKFPAALENCR